MNAADPNDTAAVHDIVLVGGGHSHAVALRRWGMQPEPGVRLTLVCTDTHTPYSGMLPGYVAGHYGHDAVHIDLRRLAAFAGARFIRAEVTGLDRSRRQVLLRDRPPLRYDWVSINTGSTPAVQAVPGAADHAVAVKPIPRFNERWLALLARVQAQDGPLAIAVVGGGAGGVELLLAMQHRLQAERRARGQNAQTLRFALLTQSPHILPTHSARVRTRLERLLVERGVQVHTHTAVTEVQPGRLRTAAGEWMAADEIVWVTQAAGPAWLADTGLPLDASGFVRVGPTLQSPADPRVFATGDVASFMPRPLEKAGVFAVRMGRPLADNLRRVVRGQATRPWSPQRHWLSLISTGERHAVASRGRGPWAVTVAGAWVWRWKDWIDRRFMQRLREFPAVDPAGGTGLHAPTHPATAHAHARPDGEAIGMRCGGCGAKVGATVLARALSGLRPIVPAGVVLGLHAADDAAVLRVPPGHALVQTVDFFRSFIDDPHVFGGIAANHALGDLYAMGAAPQSALAVATLPPGPDPMVEDLLAQMMAGAVATLNAAGCALVGGHSGEGRELALGFAVNGLLPADLSGLMRKCGLAPGDRLILTKALGTGMVLAALARIGHVPMLRGHWVDAALASMVQSSRAAAAIVQAHGARACTDVTGFGLLGHLVEMTQPSGVHATLSLRALPLLPGALDCAAAGIASTLAPANERLRPMLRNAAAFAAHPQLDLLFDPQTAGGLLAGVPADRAADCVAALHAAGYEQASIIGEVLPTADDGPPIGLQP